MFTDLEESTTARLLGRPRRRISKRSMRRGIRAVLNSGKLTADQSAALQKAHDDDDVLEILAQHAADDGGLMDPADPETPKPKRDWTTFFGALGDFLVKIFPLILKLLSAFGLGGVAAAATSDSSPHLAATDDPALYAGDMPTNFAVPSFTVVWALVKPALMYGGKKFWPDIKAAGDTLFGGGS